MTNNPIGHNVSTNTKITRWRDKLFPFGFRFSLVRTRRLFCILAVEFNLILSRPVGLCRQPQRSDSRYFYSQGTPGLPGPIGDKGVRGDKGDRGLTTTLKGDQFPTGIIEGPPGPPGPPGNDIVVNKRYTYSFVIPTRQRVVLVRISFLCVPVVVVSTLPYTYAKMYFRAFSETTRCTYFCTSCASFWSKSHSMLCVLLRLSFLRDSSGDFSRKIKRKPKFISIHPRSNSSLQNVMSF